MDSDTLPIIPETDKKFQGYSASVHIELLVDGKAHLPAQTTSNELLFRDVPNLADSIGQLGQLIVSIDGVPHHSTVKILPHTAPTNRIPIELQK